MSHVHAGPVALFWMLLEHAESWPGSFWGLGLEPGPSHSYRFPELSPNACQLVKAGVGHNSCRNQAGSKERSLQIKENCFGKKQATNNL